MTCLDRDWLLEYPGPLVQALAEVAERFQAEIFITGGAVRDWLLGRSTADLDITVSVDPFGCCRLLAQRLGAAFVPLDEKEGVARLVWGGCEVDFSGFREGVSSLEEDLARRDFTINALAVAFDPKRRGLLAPYAVIDPMAGVADLRAGLIRATSGAVFEQDPLRMLRAYRFMAMLGFALDPDTEQRIRAGTGLIRRSAGERISAEFHKIMAAGPSHEVIGRMARGSGLLWEIFPELQPGAGLAQPASHHLDVFNHNLAALERMAEIIADPARFFPASGREMAAYLDQGRAAERLKWAALFHDLGKPSTHRIREGRITFYGHDATGAELFTGIAGRLRLGREETGQVRRLIEFHMWPFHLSNAWRTTGITPRACLRLVKAVGDDLPGLFLLAMADSLAGQGPGRPPAMEKELARLYEHVQRMNQQNIRPVLSRPRLINGHDLQRLFGLPPGPVFRDIFAGLEAAQVAGEIKNRPEAIAWVRAFLAGEEESD